MGHFPCPSPGSSPTGLLPVLQMYPTCACPRAFSHAVPASRLASRFTCLAASPPSGLSFNALLSEAILVLKDTSTPLAFSTVALLVPSGVSVINHRTVYFPSSVSLLDWKHHKGRAWAVVPVTVHEALSTQLTRGGCSPTRQRQYILNGSVEHQ